MKIRTATTRDAAAIDDLMKQLHPEITSSDLRVRQRSRKFVATERGKVLGFLLATFTDYGISPYAMIEELVVGADARRAGTGAALLEAATTWAQESGAEVVFVSANPDAEPFYVRWGFARCTGPWLYRLPRVAA